MTPQARTFIAAGLTGIYATCFVIIKIALPFAPPLFFGGLRALMAGLVLLGLAGALRQPLLPERETWGWVIAIALTATTLNFGAMFYSPMLTGAGIASVLGNIQPLIVAALAALFLGEAITRGKGIALALGLTGVTLISAQALAAPGPNAIAGAALALTASVGASIGSVLFKRLGTHISVLTITAWQLIIGSLPLLAASVIVERGTLVTWNIQFVGALLFLALVGTALANATWFWLVQSGEVSRLIIFLYLVPVFGLVLAALVLGERIGWLEGLGSALIFAAIASSAWEARRPPSYPAP